MSNEDIDVLIVGCGPAGIGLATRLIDLCKINNCSCPNIQIVEARYRVGGRAYTRNDLFGVGDDKSNSHTGLPVDVGASWIHHFSQNNPIHSYIKKAVLKDVNNHSSNTDHPDIDNEEFKLSLDGLVSEDGEFVLFDSSGKRITNEIYSIAVSIYDHLIKVCESIGLSLEQNLPSYSADFTSLLNNINKKKPPSYHLSNEILNYSAELTSEYIYQLPFVKKSDQSVAETMAPHISAAIASVEEKVRDQVVDVLNWLISGGEQYEAAPFERLSSMCWPMESQLVECDMLVSEGYGNLIKRLFDLLPLPPVLFGHVVTSIDSTDKEKIIVNVNKEDQNGGLIERIQIEAKNVVICVPLGIMKHKLIQFNPPLPNHKQLAIENMGFGLMNKIILQFDNCWWDDKIQSLGYIQPIGSKSRVRWLFAPNYRAKKVKDQNNEINTKLDHHCNNILVAFVTCESAVELESLSDGEQVEQVMKICRKIYRNRNQYSEVDSGERKKNLFIYPQTNHTDQQSEQLFQQKKIECCEVDCLILYHPSHFTSYESIYTGHMSNHSSSSSCAEFDLPSPRRYYVTRWLSDRFSLGSYSHAAYPNSSLTVAINALPIDGGRIGFAGEHTSLYSIGCVDSAWESGMREAKRLFDIYMEQNYNNK